MSRLARKYHKWLMAFVGIQFLFWTITGLYMVSMDIHDIHGEQLQKHESSSIVLAQVTYPISSLVQRFPTAKNITVSQLMERNVYQFTVSNPNKKSLLVDAATGEVLPEITKADASDIARFYYAGQGAIQQTVLLVDKTSIPSELSPRHLPVWQVSFDNFSAATFYISQQTGQIVTKRHDYWRLFDWMWRFHIMDYDDGENVSNWLLLLVSSLALIAVLMGGVLTYFRVIKPTFKSKAGVNPRLTHRQGGVK